MRLLLAVLFLASASCSEFSSGDRSGGLSALFNEFYGATSNEPLVWEWGPTLTGERGVNPLYLSNSDHDYNPPNIYLTHDGRNAVRNEVIFTNKTKRFGDKTFLRGHRNEYVVEGTEDNLYLPLQFDVTYSVSYGIWLDPDSWSEPIRSLGVSSSAMFQIHDAPQGVSTGPRNPPMLFGVADDLFNQRNSGVGCDGEHTVDGKPDWMISIKGDTDTATRETTHFRACKLGNVEMAQWNDFEFVFRLSLTDPLTEIRLNGEVIFRDTKTVNAYDYDRAGFIKLGQYVWPYKPARPPYRGLPKEGRSLLIYLSDLRVARVENELAKR